MRSALRLLRYLAIPATLLALAAPALATHPRPKGAWPFYAPLVPAYEPCAAPDREHGPPLAFPSCSPTQTSQYVTVGTPDANGAAANSNSWFKWRVSVGNPGPPHDTRTLIDAIVSDVRCTASATTCGSANASGGADYTGQLEGVIGMRITDHNNSVDPGGGNDAATMVDYTFRFRFLCTATADATIGSSCVLRSDPAAIIPGFTPETERAIWELTRAEFYDGGADGDAATTGDNTLFLAQGVFVP